MKHQQIDPTMTETAALLGVSLPTIYAWCVSGKLQRYREFGDSGKYRVPMKSVNMLLATRRRESKKAARRYQRAVAQESAS